MTHTVMVVDDDADILEAMQDVLRDEGYQVVVAHNGQEALSLLERMDPPCLMIVDMVMPLMDGAQLLEKLTQNQRFAGVQRVILSANSTMKPPVGTKAFRKPIGVKELLSLVNAHC